MRQRGRPSRTTAGPPNAWILRRCSSRTERIRRAVATACSAVSLTPVRKKSSQISRSSLARTRSSGTAGKSVRSWCKNCSRAFMQSRTSSGCDGTNAAVAGACRRSSFGLSGTGRQFIAAPALRQKHLMDLADEPQRQREAPAQPLEHRLLAHVGVDEPRQVWNHGCQAVEPAERLVRLFEQTLNGSNPGPSANSRRHSAKSQGRGSMASASKMTSVVII